MFNPPPPSGHEWRLRLSNSSGWRRLNRGSCCTLKFALTSSRQLVSYVSRYFAYLKIYSSLHLNYVYFLNSKNLLAFHILSIGLLFRINNIAQLVRNKARKYEVTGSNLACTILKFFLLFVTNFVSIFKITKNHFFYYFNIIFVFLIKAF